jgi:hypothetical protein
MYLGTESLHQDCFVVVKKMRGREEGRRRIIVAPTWIIKSAAAGRSGENGQQWRFPTEL